MAASELDRCVHCGLCLNACPTYRELGIEMDSPRGRIYQMSQIAAGAPITDSYREHIDLCLACRACETACPSGVKYGLLVESARAEIEEKTVRPWRERLIRGLVFRRLLPSRLLLQLAGRGLWLYQSLGLQALARRSGILKMLGLDTVESLAPGVETPFFFRQYGRVFPAEGTRRYRVALLGGCIANLSFARLNEATVRVLQKNGCEVTVPAEQTCCGALSVHAGVRDQAQKQARQNIKALADAPFDAILTNAAGCGSTLKEYPELLPDDPKARKFSEKVKDVTEFLAAIGLVGELRPLAAQVTYQDSCHLLHGQKVRQAPRTLLKSIPGLQFRELPGTEICCGSAGVYNILHTDMSMSLLEKKMDKVNATRAEIIATANPGCMLQLRAGVTKWGHNQRVVHIVELLDESYGS